MMSSVQYINGNINNQEWNIDIGHSFEDSIYRNLLRTLDLPQNDKIKIFQTEATNDGGKDIIITSQVNLNLFDINITLKGKKEIKIYIECKSSDKEKISFEKIAKNSVIAGQDRVDYFILVTNKTITPFTYYSIYENSNQYNYEFLLVDQYLLHNFFEKHNLNKWKYIKPDNIPEISLSYQTCKSSYKQDPCIELYLLCRNYSCNDVDCSFNIYTDRNWKIQNLNNIFVVEKNKSKCFKLMILKNYSDGLDELLIQFEFNDYKRIIEIKHDFLNYNFQLPLTGDSHRKIIQIIKDNLLHAKGFVWFNLYGEAGIGKTRIIDEICKESYGRGINIINYLCTKNRNTSNFECLKKEVCKALKKSFTSENIEYLIREVQDEYFKKAIIIEDIHNADKEFISMLYELSLKSQSENDFPVVLITTGRDDYTVYNEDYFSLLDKINEKESNNIFSYEVKHFKESECKNLIKSVIKDIPNEVLDKLYNSSRNNPFYLVQFIEYLLEIELVTLLNRDTVGIPNVHTFSQNLYLPKQIEDLLDKRLKNLLRFDMGNKLHTFLLAASMYGIEFPKKLMYCYFSEDELNNTEILFKTHLITTSGKDNQTLKFDHETIYLFLRNKKKTHKLCKEIYEITSMFELYDNITKGIIYCILKKYEAALLELNAPINEIINMNNVSSENISPEYFDSLNYVYDIFRHKKNVKLMKRTLLSKVYVAMHNLSMGRAIKSFDEVGEYISKYHSNDELFALEIKQLQASFYLSIGMISKSRGLMIELLAAERKTPDIFNDETKYNLFERTASLFIHSNHLEPAILYNHMSFELAEKMNNNKLKALSKINEAKAYFFIDTNKSYNIIKEADNYLKLDLVPRINCHNQLGMLTAKIILSDNIRRETKQLIKEAEGLLELSLNVKYPLDVIRSHCILAVLSFVSEPKEIENCKRHIEYGVDASVRFGILKLMPTLYCLKALVAIYEEQNKDYILQVFNTMTDYLNQEDLLFLGNLDFTYSNIILLTNYLIFLEENTFESKIYELLHKITYYGYSAKCDFQCDKHTNCRYTCANDLSLFKQNYDNIKQGSLLLVNPEYKFRKIYKNYFFPLLL